MIRSATASGGRLPAGESPDATESDDPRNALLDAFEAQIAALIDNGLEPQLRTRLARLLPPPAPASKPRPHPASESGEAALRESHARFLLGLSLMRRNAGHARRLKDVAAALAPHITTEKTR